MFNKVVLVGNLTRDIEIRSTSGGMMIGATAIAVTRKFTDTNGEKREETCFIDITFFARLAEIANLYLRKGSKVLIEGRLRQENWVDQNGGKRSKHSIVVENLEMLGTNPQNNGDYENNSYSQNNTYGTQNTYQNGYNNIQQQNTQASQEYYKKPEAQNTQSQKKQDIKTIDLEDMEDSEDLPF